jgi:hypothetical protein
MPTAGLFFSTAGLRYDLFVVMVIVAQTMPCQQK